MKRLMREAYRLQKNSLTEKLKKQQKHHDRIFYLSRK